MAFNKEIEEAIGNNASPLSIIKSAYDKGDDTLKQNIQGAVETGASEESILKGIMDYQMVAPVVETVQQVAPSAPAVDQDNVVPTTVEDPSLLEQAGEALGEVVQPLVPGAKALGSTIQQIGATTGQIAEKYLNLLPGVDSNVYGELTNRLAKRVDEENKQVAKSLGESIITPSEVSKIALAFPAQTLKGAVIAEGLIQALTAPEGERLEAGATGAGLTLVGGKAAEKVIDTLASRYVGSDRLLRKLKKTIGMTDEEASQHFEDYAKVVGKDVKSFDTKDKVNAIVQGSKEAESVLMESVATDPANSKMLNQYYKEVTKTLKSKLDTASYEELQEMTRGFKTDTDNMFNTMRDTFDEMGTPVQLSDNLKEVITKHNKSIGVNPTEYDKRVLRLLNDEGHIGDLFEVEKQTRLRLDKIDKLGTDAALTREKEMFKDEAQSVLKDKLPESAKQAREEINKVYTLLKSANEKDLVEVFQSKNVNLDSYKKVLDAMKSTRDDSSYSDVIRMFGKDSKAASNYEEFVVDSILTKNIDDVGVANMELVAKDLDNINFRTPQGKALKGVFDDVANAFSNMQSTEAWKAATLDRGGLGSDIVERGKVFTVGEIFNRLTQYLPTQAARRTYVIRHLPEYLKSGKLPTNLSVDETSAFIEYKNIFENANQLLAKSLDDAKTEMKQLPHFPGKENIDEINLQPLFATESGTVARQPGVAVLSERQESVLLNALDDMATSGDKSQKIRETIEDIFSSNRYELIANQIKRESDKFKGKTEAEMFESLAGMVARETEILQRQIEKGSGLKLPEAEVKKLIQLKIKDMM